MIGLVFQALIAYVVILVFLCRSPSIKVCRAFDLSKIVSQENKICDPEEKQHLRKREWILEIILFIWVGGSALVFNAIYWSKSRNG